MKLEFHHINVVSEDVDRLHHFYTDTLGLTDISITSFPRPKETENTGYSGKIRFATDGQMNLTDSGGGDEGIRTLETLPGLLP